MHVRIVRVDGGEYPFIRDCSSSLNRVPLVAHNEMFPPMTKSTTMFLYLRATWSRMDIGFSVVCTKMPEPGANDSLSLPAWERPCLLERWAFQLEQLVLLGNHFLHGYTGASPSSPSVAGDRPPSTHGCVPKEIPHGHTCICGPRLRDRHPPNQPPQHRHWIRHRH
jgi:hypothetical protein